MPADKLSAVKQSLSALGAPLPFLWDNKGRALFFCPHLLPDDTAQRLRQRGFLPRAEGKHTLIDLDDQTLFSFYQTLPDALPLAPPPLDAPCSLLARHPAALCAQSAAVLRQGLILARGGDQAGLAALMHRALADALREGRPAPHALLRLLCFFPLS